MVGSLFPLSFFGPVGDSFVLVEADLEVPL